MASHRQALGGTTHETIRADIQALRGLAVLLVLLYHTGLDWVAAGYLGVDMFFVISGFLITRIIVRDVDAGRFRFAAFYYHRARRILPAAYVTILLTVLAAAFLLTDSQLAQFRDQVIGSVLFVGNFVLWDQTGYFSREAWQQPLLHMWSLAIEEQYYLVVPFTVVLLRGRVRTAAIALAIAASFTLCMMAVLRSPAAAFFLLPTRGWELGIGSLGALAGGGPRVRALARTLLWPAVGVALLVPLVSLHLPHPGPAALLVCLATVTIILAQSATLNGSSLLRPLARVGDISYSLYLVHWPLFAFARVVYMERDLPHGLTAALGLTSFVLAYALYRFVETPLRAIPLDRRRVLVGGLVAAGALLIAVPVALVGLRGPGDTRALAGVEGFKGCLMGGKPAIATRCAQSPAPDIVVWGDSYGAHIMPGLDATTLRPIEQQTRGMCGPMADFTEQVGLAERAKAQGCLVWNERVLRYLATRPSVGVVVLASRYDRFLNPEASIASSQGVAEIPPAQRAAAVRDSILLTAQRLRTLGKRVVLIAPPPASRFDQGLCWERKHQQLPILGPAAGCRLRPDVRARLEPATIAMLSDVQRGGVPVIFLANGMCRGGQCASELRGRPLYRDAGHLTSLGSIFAARSNNLGAQVWSRAR